MLELLAVTNFEFEITVLCLPIAWLTTLISRLLNAPGFKLHQLISFSKKKIYMYKPQVFTLYQKCQWSLSSSSCVICFSSCVFHNEGVCMTHKMTVQNTVNLASSSAHYLFYLSVSCLHFPLECWLEAVSPLKINRLAASLYWLRGSKCVEKKVAVYSMDIMLISLSTWLQLPVNIQLSWSSVNQVNSLWSLPRDHQSSSIFCISRLISESLNSKMPHEANLEAVWNVILNWICTDATVTKMDFKASFELHMWNYLCASDRL